jgi:hypothetical protein
MQITDVNRHLRFFSHLRDEDGSFAILAAKTPAQGDPIRVVINYFATVHSDVLALIQRQQLGVLRFVVLLLAFDFSLLFDPFGAFRLVF